MAGKVSEATQVAQLQVTGMRQSPTAEVPVQSANPVGVVVQKERRRKILDLGGSGWRQNHMIPEQSAGGLSAIEAIIWRCQNGAKWRSLPAEFGPW
jgi:hypothetical protein